MTANSRALTLKFIVLACSCLKEVCNYLCVMRVCIYVLHIAYVISKVLNLDVILSFLSNFFFMFF